MIRNEVWRLVPTLSRIIVSSEGRVMRLPYLRSMPHGGRRQVGGTPTFGQWDGKRYILVVGRKCHKVARLVCEGFHGPAPSGRPVCMHLDENPLNNRPGNLAWGTQKENLNAPGFLAYCRERKGDRHPFVKARMRRAEAEQGGVK